MDKKDIIKKNKKNQKTGRKLEDIIVEEFGKRDFFVRKDGGLSSGQTFDIFCAKDNFFYILEVKNCKENYFDKRRITDNQKLTKIRLENTGNKYAFYVYRNETENKLYISKKILKDISEGMDLNYFLDNYEEVRDNEF